jgi:hypothetical protein
MKSSIWPPDINESKLIMDNACQEIHSNFLLTQTSVSYQKNCADLILNPIYTLESMNTLRKKELTQICEFRQ